MRPSPSLLTADLALPPTTGPEEGQQEGKGPGHSPSRAPERTEYQQGPGRTERDSPQGGCASWGEGAGVSMSEAAGKTGQRGGCSWTACGPDRFPRCEVQSSRRHSRSLRVHAGPRAPEGSSGQQGGEVSEWSTTGRLGEGQKLQPGGAEQGLGLRQQHEVGNPEATGSQRCRPTEGGGAVVWIPLSRKRWPCRSPSACPPPARPAGAPLPIELKRGLSRQHCPDS